MRVGLTSIYSFRPHVEHMAYLANELERAKIDISFLSCDSSVSTCYAKELKGDDGILACAKCMLGGIRTYRMNNIFSIKKEYAVSLPIERVWSLIKSSICTINRFEIEEDFSSLDINEEINKYKDTIEVVYGSTLRWIKEKKLDAVVCFNGRMDLTAAVMEACRDAGCRFISQERTWFSHGIQLNYEENCLSLREVNVLNQKYQDLPLTKKQAEEALSLIASRFGMGVNTEWRVYNQNSTPGAFVGFKKNLKKVLVLPSSHNEFYGHPDWISSWESYVKGFDWAIKELGVPPENVLVRCHPNWGEYIGKNTGKYAEEVYTKWSLDNKYGLLRSNERANTLDLIKECDVLLVNGSSAAIEAGIFGKLVICIGHSVYEKAGISISLDRKPIESLNSLIESFNLGQVRQKTLRHLYTMSARFPFLSFDVVAESSVKFHYRKNADFSKVIYFLKTGEIISNDEEFADSPSGEIEVLDSFMKGQFQANDLTRKNIDTDHFYKVKRMLFFRWVDFVRNLLPRGDR